MSVKGKSAPCGSTLHNGGDVLLLRVTSPSGGNDSNEPNCGGGGDDENENEAASSAVSLTPHEPDSIETFLA